MEMHQLEELVNREVPNTNPTAHLDLLTAITNASAEIKRQRLLIWYAIGELYPAGAPTDLKDDQKLIYVSLEREFGLQDPTIKIANDPIAELVGSELTQRRPAYSAVHDRVRKLGRESDDYKELELELTKLMPAMNLFDVLYRRSEHKVVEPSQQVRMRRFLSRYARAKLRGYKSDSISVLHPSD